MRIKDWPTRKRVLLFFGLCTAWFVSAYLVYDAEVDPVKRARFLRSLWAFTAIAIAVAYIMCFPKKR